MLEEGKYINVSATVLDSFQHWLNGKWRYADMDHHAFCEELIKPFEPSPVMQYGTTMHDFIEKGDAIRVEGGIKSPEGIFIPEEELGDAPALREFLLKEGFELEAWAPHKAIVYRGVEFRIRGKVDGKKDNIIIDHKFKSPRNGFLKDGYVNDYMDSWQWQIYLWLTGANRFVYNIFYRHERDFFDENNKKTRGYTNTLLQPIILYRFTEMEMRCEQFAKSFFDFLFDLNMIERLWQFQEEKRQKKQAENAQIRIVES